MSLASLRLVLTVRQIERISNIFDNAGQVIFGIAVLSPLITGFENVNIFVILTGVIGVIACWGTSILLERRVFYGF